MGERGTLTILPNGDIIIGAPSDSHLTQADAARMSELVKGWDREYPLVLSWPVDVIDLRDKP
jgi:hypothetical protein